MRRITTTVLTGLLTLASACGGGDDRQLEYGVPLPPTPEEQAAASQAEGALNGLFSFTASPEPSVGGPGLADQLVASLGGQENPAAPAPARRAVGRALAVAASPDPLDPCLTTTPTSVTWSACVITVSETDPLTLDTTDITLRIDGTLSWNPDTGVTSWSIQEGMTMDMTSDGSTLRMSATVGLGGSITLTASTIKGHTASSVAMTMASGVTSASAAVSTTLDLDLTYADPFCVTDGVLTLQQVWARRPAGSTSADLPDQGWRFDWAGCGLFTVSHGS